jgi:hypothetical protein
MANQVGCPSAGPQDTTGLRDGASSARAAGSPTPGRHEAASLVPREAPQSTRAAD